MNEQQKKQALAIMKKHQNIPYDLIALELSRRFGIQITAKECALLYMESLF